MTPTVPVRRRERPADPRRSSGRPDWAPWPAYDAAATGLREYWYPVAWSTQVGAQADGRRGAARSIVLQRDERRHGVRPARSLPAPRRAAVAGQAGVPRHDHLPVPRLDVPAVRRRARAPSSPTARTRRCAARSAVATYPVDEALGLVWVYIGDGEPHPLTDAAPRGARRRPADGASAAGSRTATATGGTTPRTASTRATPSTSTARRTGACSRRCRRGTRCTSSATGAGSTASRTSATGTPTFPGLGTLDQPALVEDASRRSRRASRSATRATAQEPDPYIAAAGLPGVRLAGHAGDAAHRLPALHPLRVLRADRRRAHEVRRRDGQVRLGPRPGVVLRPLPRRDPLAVPRQLLRPGPLDGRRDRRPAGAPLPARRVAAGVAPPGRGGPPVAPANRTKGHRR